VTGRVVFATTEFEPLTPGGAGVLIGRLAALHLERGWSPTVVLAAAAAGAPDPSGVEVVTVDSPEAEDTVAFFVERSRRLALAVARVAAEGEAPVLIEFHDFDAPAWWTLTHRRELGLDAVRIGVRLHGPVDAMIEAMGIAPPPLDRVALMERLVFSMADLVLVPSAAMGDWAIERYRLEPGRVVVAPVPVPAVETVAWSPSVEPEFVVYGRLHEVKGSHDLVEAAVPVLDDHPGARIRFIGPDGWSATENRPMSEVIAAMIPQRHRRRIVVEGALARRDALEAMASAWAVVVPSRFESFCIAAHEVRRAGLPVIAPRMPAFAEHSSGMLLYDGTRRGLTAALASVASDRSIADRLAAEPPPRVGEPMDGYVIDLPPPRHPQTQAGLATVAVKEFEATEPSMRSRSTAAARLLLRALPRPVARAALRVVPRRLKDRFRALASWPEEEARRAAGRRMSDLRRAVSAGAFAEVADPQITVVIPCFEQGRWVAGAVASVFEQSHSSWEIVLVDDGSTDPATIDELDRLAAWPRVRMVRHANRGLPGARNAGIERARGRFVVPLDADDELAPTFMERTVEALEGRPDAAFAHCWARLFGDVDAVWVPRPHNPYWEMLSNGVVGCVLLRRRAWEAVGGYDETMLGGHEDWELWLRLAAAGWERVRVPAPLFHYRKHGVSMSVGSEADFEGGLRRLVDRHPGLYEVSRLREVKAAWYPLISLITAPGTDPPAVDDAQVIVVGGGSGGLGVDDVAAAVAASRGKYVADVRTVMVDPGAVLRLADRLEAASGAAWARDEETGTVVWRRWALVDPAAEVSGGAGEPGAPDPEGELAAGAFPDADWVVDRSAVPEGTPIMRQRPEEVGHLPAWVTRA
jgi:glycosyltransferase involved in cell wall biosynthesis